MTEKEKMLAGRPYLAKDEELSRERSRAREILYSFNTLPPDKNFQRGELLHSLFGGMGNDAYLEPPFRCDYGYNIFLGDGFYANYNLTVLDCAKVVIGNHVFIGPNVSLLTAGHPLDPQLRNSGLEFARPITIGDNVWLGAGAIVNPGVKIGRNTVVGSGSVVTKDLPCNVIAAGNPCRVLRAITPEDSVTY